MFARAFGRFSSKISCDGCTPEACKTVKTRVYIWSIHSCCCFFSSDYKCYRISKGKKSNERWSYLERLLEFIAFCSFLIHLSLYLAQLSDVVTVRIEGLCYHLTQKSI